jgi:hypothetical protein
MLFGSNVNSYSVSSGTELIICSNNTYTKESLGGKIQAGSEVISANC